jgi:Replication-relaxation
MRPTARPAASSPVLRSSLTRRQVQPFSPPTDSPSRHPKYLTTDRLRSIQQALGPRDREVLIFVSAARLASGGQLARRFWNAPSGHDSAAARAARRALKRLAAQRVLDPLPRRIGGERGGSAGLVYGVGIAGVKLLARTGFQARRLQAPGAMFIDHTLAVTELAVVLHEADRDGVLELIEVQFEPTCWRGFLGSGLARVTLKPDLFARIGAGALEDRWFIERDMNTQSGSTIRTKAERHLAYWRSGSEQVSPRVLWVVPDGRRADQIEAVVRQLPSEAQRLFAVTPASEVAAFLAAEAGA